MAEARVHKLTGLGSFMLPWLASQQFFNVRKNS